MPHTWSVPSSCLSKFLSNSFLGESSVPLCAPVFVGVSASNGVKPCVTGPVCPQRSAWSKCQCVSVSWLAKTNPDEPIGRWSGLEARVWEEQCLQGTALCVRTAGEQLKQALIPVGNCRSLLVYNCTDAKMILMSCSSCILLINILKRSPKCQKTRYYTEQQVTQKS